jgi:hypothetical protein
LRIKDKHKRQVFTPIANKQVNLYPVSAIRSKFDLWGKEKRAVKFYKIIKNKKF